MSFSFKPRSDEEFLSYIASYLQNDDRLVSNLANLSALIYQYLDNISWCGFYLLDGNELYLGPFQGKVACTKIKIGKGVCGTSYQRGETIVVDDVNTFPGHIACDSASRSEIVVPIEGFGVLDIDSTSFSRFGEREKALLEEVMNLLSKKLNCSNAY
ncbi:GAF domain-containing protein [Bullifex porci]|uniref:GAF domain-containing protein n=1 Tax=Bullifex porci TaxID=2606638 RepID=UPI0023F44685|nr:GAF domain-containing protein [Bullifex porci]MDD7588343.1 GAF domain-containing protein [Bullifex porci]